MSNNTSLSAMTNYTEDEQERIAIIAEGCNVSPEVAERRYQALVKDTGQEFAVEAVNRLKSVIMARKVRVAGKSWKDKASDEVC